MYGRPPARFGQGALARIEMFIDNEKDGKIQKIYLEGNLDPQSIPLRCEPPPPPPKK